MSDLLDKLAVVASEVDFTSYREGEDSTRLTVESARDVVKAVIGALADETNDTSIQQLNEELNQED